MTRFAMWLLKWVADEALAGDVAEQCETGRGSAWLWRQVLVAAAQRLTRWPRRHWPEIAFALAGIATMPLLAPPLNMFFRSRVPWWTLPFPFSQLLSDLVPATLTHLAALPVLALGLVLTSSFRWQVLARTILYGLVFVLAGYYSFAVVEPTMPLAGSVRIFCALLMSAWLACRRAAPMGGAEKVAAR